MRRVSDRAHARSQTLRVDVSDRLRPNIQHQCIDERDVVTDPGLVRYLQRRRRLRSTLAQGCVLNRLYLVGKGNKVIPSLNQSVLGSLKANNGNGLNLVSTLDVT